jgi:hypothetical protein
LAAPLVNLFFFLSIQTLEHFRGKALFEFGGSEGYIKDTTEHPLKTDVSNHTAPISRIGDADEENSDEAPSGYKPRKSVMAFEEDDGAEPTPDEE